MASDRQSPPNSRERRARARRTGGGSEAPRSPERSDRSPDRSEPRLTARSRDWLAEAGLSGGTDEGGGSGSVTEEAVKETSEGAFSVLARFGATAARAPSSPLSRWRRSAIRIAANNSSRKLREAARLKALQRTPYPLVLARIKLLLDRLAVFKDHVSAMGSPAPASSKSRRRMGAMPVAAPPWGDGGPGEGVSRAVAAVAGGGPEQDEEDQLVASAIKNWDLRKAGGHLPSGPMEVLSRMPSRMQPQLNADGRSPAGCSEDEEEGSGSGYGYGYGYNSRSRRSPSPARSITGLTSATAATTTGLRSSELDLAAGDMSCYVPDMEGMALDDPGSGNKMSLDKLLEELSTTMSYVSDFLRKVPEETRMEACFAAKMENYKKDQTVYRIGDPPERFHLILTGVVEIWTHPSGNRREKTLIATLKKGQSFGEMAILNDEPRAEVATPTSNCTFLTFHRHDLLSTFGPYFRERLLAAEAFFHSRVPVFQALPKHHTLRVISHMMQSTFPAGKDWEPVADQQIYFIKTGSAALEALDRRFAGTVGAPAGAAGAAAG
ncbi:hypothetical protein Agub_g10726, partial [Astrephomene gubernaculifera]